MLYTVEPSEWCDLLVSPRNLVRCDDDSAGLHGLEDVETGERFYINQAKLFSFALS